MWRVGLALVLLGTLARANGRDDATITINFQLGNPQHIVAGTTFGTLRSDDGGATWWWMCEKAVFYGGEFDPVYAYSASGAVFATTFEGLMVMRDGCSFVATPAGTTMVSTDELGSDGSLFYAAADPADGKIYRSNDDGMTFPVGAAPGRNDDWWESLKIAPTDPLRVYLTGYRFEKFCTSQSPTPGIHCMVKADCGPDGSDAPNYCESLKEFLLFRSDDGGVSYTPMSETGITTTSASVIAIAGIDPSNKDTVYVKSSFEDGGTGDGLYKSSDGGATWMKILHTADKYGLSVIVRSSGELVAATKLSGTQRSPGGASCVDVASCNWTPVASAPHINCLVEHPATHELWACTEDRGTMDTPADGYGMMRTADLETWTGVMRFEDIAGFVKCDDSTIQAQQCVAPFDAKPSVWCCIRDQLGITAGGELCTGLYACEPQPGSEAPPPPPGGCCEGTHVPGGAPIVPIVLGLGTAALLLRRRRT